MIVPPCWPDAHLPTHGYPATGTPPAIKMHGGPLNDAPAALTVPPPHPMPISAPFLRATLPLALRRSWRCMAARKTMMSWSLGSWPP